MIAPFAFAVLDCEAVRAGWPDQPINAWSSLAFAAVGAWVVARYGGAAVRTLGIAAALVGSGSLLFHGGRGAFGDWLHNWSIVALLLAVVGCLAEKRAVRWALVVAAAASAIAVAVAPGSARWLAVAAIPVVVSGLVIARARLDRRSLMTAVALAAGGAALDVLGRSGGPWCRPEAWLQAHAGWHLLGAAAVAVFVGSLPDRTEEVARSIP